MAAWQSFDIAWRFPYNDESVYSEGGTDAPAYTGYDPQGLSRLTPGYDAAYWGKGKGTAPYIQGSRSLLRGNLHRGRNE